MGTEGGVRMDNDCRNCKHAKDKFHDSCYCTYYGYIRSKPKKDCWGWEQRTEKDNKEEKE
jgi:hypothetical protein